MSLSTTTPVKGWILGFLGNLKQKVKTQIKEKFFYFQDLKKSVSVALWNNIEYALHLIK
jgi:hypothetical protein